MAVGTAVPWRDAGSFGPGFQFTAEGYARADGEEDPRAMFRTVSPGFFASLGVPIVAGTDDPIIPIINAHIMARLLPHATLHTHPGGHVDLLTNASTLGPIIEDFLAT